MQITLAEHNLYRAIAELAYVVGKADKILHADEREAFKKAVEEELGEYGWLAESRFSVLQDEVVPEIDVAYNNVIFLIKQNKQALTLPFIQKFVNVIMRVAEVRGIVEEEQMIIDKFRADIGKIFQDQ